MNTKIYFNNLAATVTERELMDLFSVYGNVVDIHIAVDRTNPEPRGHGFVTMITPEGARAAIQSLGGKALGTGVLTLSEATPDKEPGGSMNGRATPRRRMSHLY
jgi:cold-inducible RNA-binding protein